MSGTTGLRPEDLKAYLDVLRGAHVLSVSLEFELDRSPVKLSVSFGMDPESFSAGPAMAAPGGWKGTDHDDPDPLGIGELDAPVAFDEPELPPEPTQVVDEAQAQAVVAAGELPE